MGELYRTSSAGESSARHLTWKRHISVCLIAIIAALACASATHPVRQHRGMLAVSAPSTSTGSIKTGAESESLDEQTDPAAAAQEKKLPAILANANTSSATQQWNILVDAMQHSSSSSSISSSNNNTTKNPEVFFDSGHTIHIPQKLQADQAEVQAPIGVRNTSLSPDKNFWGKGQGKTFSEDDYHFDGSGGSVTESHGGKHYMMKQLAQSSYGGQRGKGWKVEEHPPAEAGWLRRTLQPVDAEGMVEMVTSKGYPSETHKCVTRDGHHLVNFRIKHGYDGPNGAKKSVDEVERQPLLLIHGISLSSTSWVVNGRDESLGFVLADEGYDVWMMNTRGNTYSREHEDFSDDDPRFWVWSLDELASEDLPAVVAYILGVTGAKKVPIVGHSQGGTIALAALSRLDKMNDAVSLLVAVAPVVYTKYMSAPVLVQFSRRANDSIVYDWVPPQEWFFMSQTAQELFLGGLCQLPPSVPACLVTTTQMFGTSVHISTLQYRRMWQKWPSPTSYYNVLHWAQMFNEPEPRFMEFNYGKEYDLKQITVPTFFVSGGRDVLAEERDTRKSREELAEGGSLVGELEIDSFSHMDFIWNTDAKESLHEPIIAALDKYT